MVIVNYETPVELNACLASLRESRGVLTEVFVVDNASAAFSAEACARILPGVRVIANAVNVGFATASNQALRLARGRYLVLLNPDAVAEPDTLAKLVAFMDARPEIGCATPRVELQDGRLDLACRRSFPTPERAFYRLSLLSRLFPRSRRFGQYNLTYLDEHREAEIDAPCGAFMIVRAEIRESVGLLNEHYFMYGEDLDWAYRIKAAGWHIVYTPITTVHHVKRASSRRSRRRTIGHFYEAMRIFYRDHYEQRYPRWVSWLTYAAIGARERVELVGARLRGGAGA